MRRSPRMTRCLGVVLAGTLGATVIDVVWDLPTSAASSGQGKIIRVEKTVSEVYVSAGSFEMGVGDAELQELALECGDAHPGIVGLQTNGTPVMFCDQYANELQHMRPRTVTLGAFLIDRDEVSVTDYRRCVASGGCTLDALIGGDERYIHSEWPIVNVTWDEARVFCAWQGKRLPTEAEWERAARGSDGRSWPWGTVARPKDWNHGQPRNAAMRALDRGQVASVDLMGDPDDSDGAEILAAPSSYTWGEGDGGIHDLAGNVAEWTADAWVEDSRRMGYQNQRPDGEWESLSTIDPVREGLIHDDTKVVRGGSWRQPTYLGRSYARDPYNLLYDGRRRFAHIGFRCVKPLR